MFDNPFPCDIGAFVTASPIIDKVSSVCEAKRRGKMNNLEPAAFSVLEGCAGFLFLEAVKFVTKDIICHCPE